MTCIFPTFDDLIFHYVYSCLAKGMVAPLPAPLNPTKTSSSLTRKPWRLAFSKLILTLWPLRVLSRCAISFQEPNTVSSRTANAPESQDRREKRRQTLLPKSLLNWSRKIKIWDLRSSTLNLTSPMSTHPWAASRAALTTNLHVQCTANHSHALASLKR